VKRRRLEETVRPRRLSRDKGKGKRQRVALATALTLPSALSLFLLTFSLFPSPFSLDGADVFAQELPPELKQPANDFANVIDAESARELDRRIRSLQQATGDVVVVATVRTFQPFADINEYKVKMFENHGRGIGARGKDNGLLLVVAVDDRKVGIEVGYDLEGSITDGFAGQVIREAMAPEFRNGNYGRGILAGTTRIINRIAEQRGATLQDVPREAVRRPEVPFKVPIWVIVIGIIILLRLTRGGRRRRRYWGGGPWSGWSSGVGPFGGGLGGGFGGFGGGGFGRGGGGGFGGFGGGRSGGGGASGGW
jgi:uncharacterized protein